MASVVFLRGVNVGGHRTFRPAALARDLSAFDVLNVGAAGTFVVRKAVTQAALRAEILGRLPFEPELMICRARAVQDLVAADPYAREAAAAGARRFVSILARSPSKAPPLPLRRPEGKPWQVELSGLYGRLALSLWRHDGKKFLYSSDVVEKELGVRATTRTWDTLRKVCGILEDR